MDEISEIKIKQDIQEYLNVNLTNDIGNSLNVNLNPGPPISIFSLPKVKVEIEKEKTNDFLYNVSNELKFHSKILLSFSLISILYGKYNITISQYLRVKLDGDREILLGILGCFIVFYITIVCLYLYRDIKKFKIDRVSEKVGFKQNIESINKSILNSEDKNTLDKLNIEKKNIINKNELINLQLYNKFLSIFFLNGLIPLFIGYLGFAYTGVYPMFQILNNFKYSDLFILILLLILFIIITKSLNKKENS